MTMSKPPALATWMLEHLTLGSDNDALAGDLLEEFAHRRSVGWYWRQVLMAILVSFSRELGRQWRAACFALVWTIASDVALTALYQVYRTRHMLEWALRYEWPQSAIMRMGLEISPQFLLWWFGLALYLMMMRSFTVTRFARGVLVSVFCMLLAFGTYVSVWAVVLRDIAHELPRHATTWIGLETVHFVYRTPLFLALLLSLCLTLPSGAMRRTITA